MSATPSPRLRTKLAFTAASVVVSLGLAETVASAVHHGAFPFLNVFEPDPELGVRLRANASTRVRSRSGRVTDIRINALGFRGKEWPKPGEVTESDAVRVLLLGDSQMFGYGVDEPLAVASQLERAGHVTVLDAAVPTFGPPDYVLALRQLAPKFRPRFVIFVANAANDWFEPVPNRQRTTAQDGWATRFGTPAATWFPFRDYVMGRSHLALGIRQITSYVGDAQPAPSQSALRLKADLPMLRRGSPPYRSTITPNLKAAVDVCAGLGCEVIAVALPLDVQVNGAEWKKYRGAVGADLTDTEALLDDFIADARALQVPAVNLMSPLRAAEPGAFLDDDYHLSPKGHRVVAEAIAPLLHGAEASLGGKP
jgi:hypothetical protein